MTLPFIVKYNYYIPFSANMLITLAYSYVNETSRGLHGLGPNTDHGLCGKKANQAQTTCISAMYLEKNTFRACLVQGL
jgi:hypothetical protein